VLSLQQTITFLYYRTLSNVLNILVLGLFVSALPRPTLYGCNLILGIVPFKSAVGPGP